MLYVLKAAITLALLYSCFFVFLSKETFHRFNRLMLVGIMLMSLVMPLFHFTTSHPTALNEEVYLVQSYIETDATPIVVTARTARSITWMQALTGIYLSGVAVMLVLTLVQVVSLVRFMRGGVRHTDAQGNTVMLHNGDVPPFSIFRYIVMSVKDYETSRPYILTHEQEHIRLGHTYDLLLLQCVKTLQWFNPFVWFLSRDLKAVHEYEADQAVINQGIDAKSYQQLLVMKVVGDRLQPFTNNLNHGSLKKRIFMMYQKPSNRWLMLKALCAVPVVALTINAFATPTEIASVEDMVKTLEKKEVPTTFDDVKGALLTMPESIDATSADNTSFAIHAVRDRYGRITGFSHDGKPADGDFECTSEYVFIDGRQATETELRNYKALLANSKFEILKTANGTAKYGYKDKHGIIVIHTQDASAVPDGDEPLLVLDGKVVEVPAGFLDKKRSLEDEEVLGQLLHINKDDIESVTVLKDAAAKAIYGDKGKNGVIEIKTKKQAEYDDKVFLVIEEPAKYVGGQEAMMRFISQNMRYPKEAQEHGIQSRVIVQFIVEKDGSLSSFEVVRNAATNQQGLRIADMVTVVASQIKAGMEVENTPEQIEAWGKSLEDEAIRVLKLMPKWEPARQRGKVVRMQYTIPIVFRLQ